MADPKQFQHIDPEQAALLGHLDHCIDAILEERMSAIREHGCQEFKTLHGAYGVIAEEFRELETEIFKKHPDRANLLKEAKQLATMCIRLYTELL